MPYTRVVDPNFTPFQCHGGFALILGKDGSSVSTAMSVLEGWSRAYSR